MKKKMDDSLLYYGFPTDGSRELDAPCFKWTHEQPRSSQPYVQKSLLHLPHNPGPNEINFMGGLGKPKGFRKSKIHPLPNTTTQTIFHMQTSNKFLKTFTENPADVCCWVNSVRKHNVQNKRSQVEKIVEEIELADNMDSPLASEVSDIPDLPALHSVGLGVKSDDLEPSKQQTTEQVVPLANDGSLKSLIIQEHQRYKSQVLLSQSEDKKSVEHQLLDPPSSRADLLHRKSKQMDQPSSKFVSGYLYGPFTDPPEPDKNMKTVNKYGIPFSMLARAKKKEEKQKLLEKTSRNARKVHIGMPILPDSACSSKLGDLAKEVRRLTLLRTPYFCTPMLRSKKKVERDVIKRDRMHRINMFFKKMSLFDTEKRRQQQRADSPVVERQKPAEELPTSDDQNSDNNMQQLYEKFVAQQFADQKRVYDERLNKKMITFSEFRNLEDKNSQSTNEEIGCSGLRDLERRNSKTVPSSAQQQQHQPTDLPLKKYRKPHLAKNDELVGELYIDPFSIEKQRRITDGLEQNNYISLMRSSAGVRNRLQVNAPTFEEERLGAKDSYFHRLCTEVDQYYIQELRVSRPRIRNFLPKSDLAKIRNTMKRRFARYYIQENLLKMQEKQLMDARHISEIENAAMCCEPVLIKGQRDAYEKFDKKFDEMKQSNIATDLLQQNFVSIKERWELLNEKILRVEIQWDNLIVCLNYYLELTASNSAKENLIRSMIRPKSNENLLDFFNQQIFPKLAKMTKIVPDIQSFNYGVDALRKKVNGLITQNLEFVWLNARFQMRFDEMLKSFPKIQSVLENLIHFQREKVIFLNKRNLSLRTKTKRMINGKLMYNSVANPPLRKIKSICQQIRKISSAKAKKQYQQKISLGNKVADRISATEFVDIQNNVMLILENLDKIPINIVKTTEQQIRQQHKKQKAAAKKAYQQNQSFQMLKRQLQHHCQLKV